MNKSIDNFYAVYFRFIVLFIVFNSVNAYSNGHFHTIYVVPKIKCTKI